MTEEKVGNVGGVDLYPISVYRYDILARRGNPQVASSFGMTPRTDVSNMWALAEVYFVCSSTKEQLASSRAMQQQDWDEAVEQFFLSHEDHLTDFTHWLEENGLAAGKERTPIAT